MTKYKIILEQEAPKCPKCKKPMKWDSYKTEMDYESGGLKILGDLYRCFKCFNLYLVNEK